MKTEQSQRAAHQALGIWCRRCSELADVVAIYQSGASKGYPTGRLDHLPLCAGCGKKAIENDNPRPRLVEHEAALARKTKQERTAKGGGHELKLSFRAASATGNSR